MTNITNLERDMTWLPAAATGIAWPAQSSFENLSVGTDGVVYPQVGFAQSVPGGTDLSGRAISAIGVQMLAPAGEAGVYRVKAYISNRGSDTAQATDQHLLVNVGYTTETGNLVTVVNGSYMSGDGVLDEIVAVADNPSATALVFSVCTLLAVATGEPTNGAIGSIHVQRMSSKPPHYSTASA